MSNSLPCKVFEIFLSIKIYGKSSIGFHSAYDRYTCGFCLFDCFVLLVSADFLALQVMQQRSLNPL